MRPVAIHCDKTRRVKRDNPSLSNLPFGKNLLKQEVFTHNVFILNMKCPHRSALENQTIFNTKNKIKKRTIKYIGIHSTKRQMGNQRALLGKDLVGWFF